MLKQSIRSILTLFAAAFVAAAISRAQSTDLIDIHDNTPNSSWQAAEWTSPPKGDKLVVITVDHPNRRQSCRIQSFTKDKLVCSRLIGAPRTYTPEQVAALILPGDGHIKLWLLLGFNGGLGTAIWGTVVFVAACPACAVGTGIAAFICFVAAAGTLAADDQPDRYLYLTPDKILRRKLGYVEH